MMNDQPLFNIKLTPLQSSIGTYKYNGPKLFCTEVFKDVRCSCGIQSMKS